MKYHTSTPVKAMEVFRDTYFQILDQYENPEHEDYDWAAFRADCAMLKVQEDMKAWSDKHAPAPKPNKKQRRMLARKAAKRQRHYQQKLDALGW